MADKKKKQSVKSIYKILAVFGCVLFVVLMILSGMGTGWITAFNAIKPGNSVTIDLTINDRSGNPLVTSDQQIYQQSVSSGKGAFYSKRLVFIANQSTTKAMIPIPVYSGNEGWSSSFALFGGEQDAISQGIIGMKVNEQKTINIPFSDAMTQSWSSAQLKTQGVNATDIHIGDKLAMAVSDNPTLSKNTTDSSYSVRVGEITSKTSDGITIDFGYPTIDVKVVSIANS